MQPSLVQGMQRHMHPTWMTMLLMLLCSSCIFYVFYIRCAVEFFRLSLCQPSLQNAFALLLALRDLLVVRPLPPVHV